MSIWVENLAAEIPHGQVIIQENTTKFHSPSTAAICFKRKYGDQRHLSLSKYSPADERNLKRL